MNLLDVLLARIPIVFVSPPNRGNNAALVYDGASYVLDRAMQVLFALAGKLTKGKDELSTRIQDCILS